MCDFGRIYCDDWRGVGIMAVGVRKHKSDLAILFGTLVLMAIGLIVIYAIGPMRANVLNTTYGEDYDQNYFFIHQLISVAVAIVAFVVAFKLPYEKMRKLSKWIMLLGLVLSIVMWILSAVGSALVKCELGACRWFSLGSLSFQPAEFLKLGLVMYLAGLIGRKKEEGTIGSWKEFWLPVGLVSVLALFFVVVVQSDLGSGLAMIAIIVSILLVSDVPMKQFLIMMGIILVVGVLAVVMFPHRMERLTTFIGGGDADASYHVDNAMLAIGTGGMFGVGIGNSVQATGYLPESINDSVFAVMGETFGFVGLVGIILIFAWILLRLLKVAERTEDLERRLVVVGVFAWVATHVVVNIAAMTGLVPVTGITLPLLSYGGTSMAFIAFSLGLTLQLSCYTGREVKNENISRRRGIGGAYHSGRSRNS